MAKKKEAKEEAPEEVLVTAAKSVGTVAGKIAAAVGLATPPEPKVPKLAKKNKARLPRREKKAQRKARQSSAL